MNSKMTGIPKGRLMKKIQCQESWSVTRPPQGGPDDRGEPEHRAQNSLVLPPVFRGEQVCDGDEGAGQHDPAADPLQPPKYDQLGHGLADARQD